ncbi:hypothetical protein D1872_354300 [compost metagenome]
MKLNGSVVPNITMVAPQSSASFKLPTGASGNVLSWQIINDFGGASKAISSNL